jgi:hypothetical protein
MIDYENATELREQCYNTEVTHKVTGCPNLQVTLVQDLTFPRGKRKERGRKNPRKKKEKKEKFLNIYNK